MSEVQSICLGIITPTFNRSELLKRTIESVISQTYLNWVMVIVDDCSTEDYEFISDYLTDSRIHYLKNHTNSGVNHTRNRALEKLEEIGCDFITLLDDDDFIATSTTFNEIVTDVLGQSNVEWFIYDVIMRGAEHNKISNLIKVEPIDYINDYLYGKKLLGDKHHFIAASFAKNKRFSKFVRNGYEWIYFIQFANIRTLYISRAVKVVEYQCDGLTKVGQSKNLKNLLLQIALPACVWFKRPNQLKAFQRMLTLSIRLPFRLFVLLFRKI